MVGAGFCSKTVVNRTGTDPDRTGKSKQATSLPESCKTEPTSDIPILSGGNPSTDSDPNDNIININADFLRLASIASSEILSDYSRTKTYVLCWQAKMVTMLCISAEFQFDVGNIDLPSIKKLVDTDSIPT
jgi:hypothetical protein